VENREIPWKTDAGLWTIGNGALSSRVVGHDRGVNASPDPALRDLEPLDDDALTAVIDAAYGPDGSGNDRPDGRPSIEMSMITSLDGSVAVDGGSRALSNRIDLAVLLRLRHLAAVTLVGAGTVRAEDYAVPADPSVHFAVVTMRGELDWDSALWRSGRATVVAPRSVSLPSHIDAIHVGDTTVELRSAVAAITERFCAATSAPVHLEGGPMLNAALHDLDLIDAVNLTISPTLVAGSGRRALHGGREELRRFRRRHVLAAGDHLLTRWVRDRTC